MKYLRKFESNDIQIKEYIIAKSKLNLDIDNFLIHVIGTKDNDVTYDGYVIIDNINPNNDIKEEVKKHYEDWSKNIQNNKINIDDLIISYQADTEEECYDIIQSILMSKKYNL